jgi:hypothetical protein
VPAGKSGVGADETSLSGLFAAGGCMQHVSVFLSYEYRTIIMETRRPSNGVCERSTIKVAQNLRSISKVPASCWEKSCCGQLARPELKMVK